MAARTRHYRRGNYHGSDCHLNTAPPDIFLSFAHEDLEWVRPLAAELERRGWRVFWDRRIPAGKSWRSHLGTRLESTRCVIVVWSEHAAA